MNFDLSIAPQNKTIVAIWTVTVYDGTIIIALARRALRFSLSNPSRLITWRGSDRVAEAHFFNELSLLFPRGERFFMDALNAYRSHPNVRRNQLLSQDIVAFMGQEAQHSRVHVTYNRQIESETPVASRLDQLLETLLTGVAKLPTKTRLAITVALEHYTATLAAELLTNPTFLKDCDPEYAALWKFHAIEECEHRSVSFDVWKETTEPGCAETLQRTAALLLVRPVFWTTATVFTWR